MSLYLQAMEENILTAPPEYKLYRDRAIFLATFLGGPLVAGYLIGENYWNLGEKQLFRKTWLYTFIALVLTVGVAFNLPEALNRSYIIPILYTALAQYLVKRLQGDRLALHARNGGEFYPIWRAAIFGLIGLSLIVGAILVIQYSKLN
jgi:hypothetical protein